VEREPAVGRAGRSPPPPAAVAVGRASRPSPSQPRGARAARRRHRRRGAGEPAAGANAAGLQGWPGAGRGGQARAQVPGGRFGGQDRKGSLTRRSFLCSDSALPLPVPVRRFPPPRCRSIGAFGELPLQSIY